MERKRNRGPALLAAAVAALAQARYRYSTEPGRLEGTYRWVPKPVLPTHANVAWTLPAYLCFVTLRSAT